MSPLTRKYGCQACMCVFAILAMSNYGRAEDDLTSVLQRLRQNREMIQTIECRFEGTPIKKPSPGKNDPGNHSFKVNWLQTPQAVRWDVSSDWSSLNNSHLWKDGVKKSLTSTTSSLGGKSVDTGSFIAVSAVEIDAHSPWMAAGYYLQSPTQPAVHSFFAKKDANVTIRAINSNGTRMLELTGTDHARIKTTVIVNPSQNYAVVKIVSNIIPDGSMRIEREIVKLQEVKPGLYFPSHVEYRIIEQNQVAASKRIEFSFVRINEEIDPSRFELKFPAGLTVVDKPKGTIYTTGDNETAIPQSIKPIPLSKDEKDALEAQRPWYKRLKYWLSISGVFLAVCIIAAIMLRRVRARAASL